MPNSSIPAGVAPNYASGWSFSITSNSLEQLLQNPAKLLVTDYSYDGTEARRYQATEINALHQNGQQVISYLSIGEAEDYRYYFQDSWKTNPPSWLGKLNPEWPGNIKVKYWDAEWQQQIIGYLDKIIESGFDGIYLDIVDGFDYWSEPNNGEGLVLDRADAAHRMIDWVEKLTAYARVEKGKPDFYIIPQNAEALLPYDSTGKFLQEISGVGVESLYYETTTRQSEESIADRTVNLNKVISTGKPVLVIDYINDQSGYQGSNKARIDDFWNRAKLAGYTPQVNTTDVAQLAGDPINNQLLLAQQSQSQTVIPSLSSTANNNLLIGQDLIDRRLGTSGDDILDGQGGDDYLAGSTGNDQISGGNDWDIVYGEWGNDFIRGGSGNDMLWGNDDNDTITGDDGDDRIVGDRGNDLLTGWAGRDIFVYENFAPETLGRDVITDFATGVDKIELRTNVFIDLANSSWSFAVVDGDPNSSNATVIYDQASGNLFYNDSGNLPAINFANLSGKPILAATDLRVF